MLEYEGGIKSHGKHKDLYPNARESSCSGALLTVFDDRNNCNTIRQLNTVIFKSEKGRGTYMEHVFPCSS